MTGDTPNGRVTNVQLYEIQLQLIERIAETERRIMAELKPLSVIAPRVERNEEEIDKLRNRSNVIDGLNAFMTIVAATIAAALGRAP